MYELFVYICMCVYVCVQVYVCVCGVCVDVYVLCTCVWFIC